MTVAARFAYRPATLTDLELLRCWQREAVMEGKLAARTKAQAVGGIEPEVALADCAQ